MYDGGFFSCHQNKSLRCALDAKMSARPFRNEAEIPRREMTIERNLTPDLSHAKPSAAKRSPLNAAIQSMRWFVSSFSFVIISLTVSSCCSAIEVVDISIPPEFWLNEKISRSVATGSSGWFGLFQ
jgi:hypothetical protein